MIRRFPDLTIYARAVPLLVRAPSVFAGPLLGAAVALVLSEAGSYLTGPIGGTGGGLFSFAANVFYSFAFGIAIIQADALERGIRTNFDAAWEDARRKAGGILLAAIGFWFVVGIARYAGALFGPGVEMLAFVAAAFFLIDTIPAAAIGGLPGQYALGASIRAVRADPLGAAILAIAFVAIFVLAPDYATLAIVAHASLSDTIVQLVQAFFSAIALGYLAFPFAKQYADVASRL